MNYKRPINYLEAATAIKDLKRYLDLVRHCFNYATDINEAKPLKELISNYDKKRQYQQLTTEIQKMAGVITHRFYRNGLSSKYNVSTEDPEYDSTGKIKNKREERFVELFLNFDTLVKAKYIHRQSLYEYTTGIIETVIGDYDRIRLEERKRWLNPVWIIAQVLRIPISIMEYMGINTNDKRTNNFVFWLVQALVLILLLLLLVKLGLSPTYIRFVG